MNKEDKIYVAGHAGLVGSAIIRQLNSRGFQNIITRTHKEFDLSHDNVVRSRRSTDRSTTAPEPSYVIKLDEDKAYAIFINDTSYDFGENFNISQWCHTLAKWIQTSGGIRVSNQATYSEFSDLMLEMWATTNGTLEQLYLQVGNMSQENRFRYEEPSQGFLTLGTP